jgi:hypothetical protein
VMDGRGGVGARRKFGAGFLLIRGRDSHPIVSNTHLEGIPPEPHVIHIISIYIYVLPRYTRQLTSIATASLFPKTFDEQDRPKIAPDYRPIDPF